MVSCEQAARHTAERRKESGTMTVVALAIPTGMGRLLGPEGRVTKEDP